MMPVVGVLEPFSECLAIGLLGWWAVYHYWSSVTASLFLLSHCLLWFTADQLLLRTLQGVSFNHKMQFSFNYFHVCIDSIF